MARRDHEGAAEAQSLLGQVRGLVRRFSIAERADTACCGMTVAQAAALEALRDRQPQRMGDLGRRLGVAPSTLTRNVGRLERAGLVACVPDPGDARSQRVALTPAGRRAAERLERQETAFARSVLERLPPERRASVAEGLADLLRAVREATEACCPGAFDHLMGGMAREESREEKRCGDESSCGERCGE